jgi:hypothetical protein
MHRMGGGHIGGGRHIGIRQIHRPHIRIGHRHPNWCRFNGRCHVHVRWHRPWIYGSTGVVATSYAVAPVVAATPRSRRSRSRSSSKSCTKPRQNPGSGRGFRLLGDQRVPNPSRTARMCGNTFSH